MSDAIQYVDGVKTGAIIVGEFVRLAIEKHLYLLANAEAKGIYFDSAEAEEYIEVFKAFKHTKGEAAGKSFQLLPWQEFIIYYIFGWKKRENDKRLIRKVYIEVPKKNGKTELAAGIGLLLSFFDGEKGAENYISAKVEKQAKLCFNAMKEMIKYARIESQEVRQAIPKPTTKRIFSPLLNSFVTCLTKDSESAEGINTHCAIVDEYHTHPDASQVENLESSTVARSQPVVFIITTAGRSLGSACYQLHQTCIDVLRGIKEDDTLFSLIYSIDEGDDWEDPVNWGKANPSIGIRGGVSIESLQIEYNKAKNEGVAKENYFKTRHLNVWVSSISAWIQDEIFKKGLVELNRDAYRNRVAFGGLDLSKSFDLSAFATLIPPISKDEPFKAFLKCYLPEDDIVELEKKHRAPYRQWQREEWITLTDGNVIDYDYIQRDIETTADYFDLKAVGYDRKFSTSIVTKLTLLGVNMKPYGQRVPDMNAPIIELENLVKANNFVYNSPILRWMMSNVAIYTDMDDGRRTNRNKSGKIDGIVALLMAFGQYLIFLGNDDDKSDLYKDEGIFHF